jgi:hypothetical protein
MNALHGLLFACLCAAGSSLWMMDESSQSDPARTAPRWPTHFQGRMLQELELTSHERAFASDFPGTVARFTDGERDIVMRWVSQPTRRLHPAEDCYRALGYAIASARIIEDAQHSRWRCFHVSHQQDRREVCEQLQDQDGAYWTDTSAWYWAALFRRSSGPWLVTTVAAAR